MVRLCESHVFIFIKIMRIIYYIIIYERNERIIGHGNLLLFACDMVKRNRVTDKSRMRAGNDYYDEHVFRSFVKKKKKKNADFTTDWSFQNDLPRLIFFFRVSTRENTFIRIKESMNNTAMYISRNIFTYKMTLFRSISIIIDAYDIYVFVVRLFMYLVMIRSTVNRTHLLGRWRQ